MGTLQGRHALIFVAAPETSYDYIQEFLQAHPQPVIVCADGGIKHAQALGLSPDLVVADFDSSNVKQVSGGEILQLQSEKDDTDTQTCMKELFKRGCTEATLVCATGGRIDHMLANISLLEEAAELGGRLTILDAQNQIFYHKGDSAVYPVPDGFQYFSLVPLDAILTDVTIQNAKYPLQDALILRAAMITISNEATAPEIIISIGSGSALVIFSRDRP